MKIIIVGGGSVGTYLVEKLSSEKHDVILIDKEEKILSELSSSFDIQTVHGNASSLKLLKEAGSESADIFIAATDSDETNIVSCLLAEHINAEMKKIARLRFIAPEHLATTTRISDVFDHFINPDAETVNILKRVVEMPGAVEVMEFGEGRIKVVGVLLGEDSFALGVPLRELPAVLKSKEEEETPNPSSMLIVAINRNGQLIVPHGDDVLQASDEVYLAGESDRIDWVLKHLGHQAPSCENIMISGGSKVGLRLAAELKQEGKKIKLLDKDAARCEVLAEKLDDVLVLHGDASSRTLLREEGIADVDLFVACSEDEEENILSALLAKKLGAKLVAVVATKSSYLNLVTEIGIDVVVSPYVAAGSGILQFVRGEKVSTVVSTRDESAEVLESVIDPNSKIAGQKLRDIALPAGAIAVGVIGEDSVEIAHGETEMKVGNRVIFFANKKTLKKLQKLIA